MASNLLDKKLDYWEHQLLDLGKRNKMINYREDITAIPFAHKMAISTFKDIIKADKRENNTESIKKRL